MQPGGLSSLAKAAKLAKKAERELHEEIFRAHRAGSSLRVIAFETSLSHESVRVIVHRISEWVESERKILESGVYGLTYAAVARGERNRAKRRARLDYLLGVRDSDG